MQFLNQFLFVLCIVVVVQSIDIRTSSFEEIYSGPGGTVSSSYKNANTAITYSKYESTVNVSKHNLTFFLFNSKKITNFIQIVCNIGNEPP